MYLFDQSKNKESNTSIIVPFKVITIFFIIVLIANYLGYLMFFKKDIKYVRNQNTLIEGYTGDLWQAQKEEQNNPITKEASYISKHLLPARYLGVFRLTFYTPHELGASNANALRTATKTVPKEGRTIAVDPKIIPKNSLVYIEGWGYYIAEDTGSAIKGQRIDIFLNNYKMAKQLGNKQQARVYVLNKGAI